MNQISGFSGLNRIKIYLSQSDQMFDIVQDFVCGGDLLRELSLVYHPIPSKKHEDQDLPKQCRIGVHLDGMQCIEELDPVELEDQFTQNLFAEECGSFAVIEEDDPV